MQPSDEMGGCFEGKESRVWGKTSLVCVDLQILKHSNVRQVIGFMSLETARERFWTLYRK